MPLTNCAFLDNCTTNNQKYDERRKQDQMLFTCSAFGKADILENEALYQKLIYMSVRRPFNALTDRPFKNFIMHTITSM